MRQRRQQHGRHANRPNRTARALQHALYALALASTAACTTANDQSYVITHFLQTTPDPTTHVCTYDPTATTGLIDSGLFDVAVSQSANAGFFLNAVVQNNLPARAVAGQLETATVYGTAFDIELHFPASFVANAAEQTALNNALALGTSAAMDKYRVPVSVGLLSPGGGVAIGIVEAVPAQIAAKLEAFADSTPTMIVSIRPLGTSSGDELVGSFVDFPVKICKNCLVEDPLPACPALGYPAAQIQMGGCNIEQDEPTTCCTQGNKTLCGAAVPVAAASTD